MTATGNREVGGLAVLDAGLRLITRYNAYPAHRLPSAPCYACFSS